MRIIGNIFVITGIFYFFIELITPSYSVNDIFNVCDAFIFILLVSALININDKPFNKKR